MGLENWSTLEELREQITLRSATPDVLYEELKNDLRYDIPYAEDRVTQLTGHWDESLYIDCVSSSQFIDEQERKLGHPLSGEQGLTYHLDKLADYILYATHNNEEDESVFLEQKEQLRELNKRRNKGNKAKAEKLKQVMIKQHKADALRPSRSKQKELRVESVAQEIEGEESEAFALHDKSAPRIFYTWKDKELNQSGRFKNTLKYWKHFSQKNQGFNSIFYIPEEGQEYYNVAYDSLNDIQLDINSLEGSLSKESATSQKAKDLKKSIKNLRRNYVKAEELLRNPMTARSGLFSIADPHGVEFLESIRYSNHRIVKTLIAEHAALNEYYQNRPGSAMWAVLQDVEISSKRVKLSETQRVLLDFIIKEVDYSFKELEEYLLHTLKKEFKRTNIDYHFNVAIKKISEDLITGGK